MAQDEMGIDAVKWAAEFNRIAVSLGYSEMNEGWLIGWFANAIMRGYDQGVSNGRNAVLDEASHAARTAMVGSDADELSCSICAAKIRDLKRV